MVGNGCLGHTSPTLTSPDPDEYDEHDTWNPMLELLCHTHIGVSMEALFDEEDLEEDRTFLSFRTGHLVRQRMSLFPKRRHIPC